MGGGCQPASQTPREPRQSWLEMIGPSAAAMVECLAGWLGCWLLVVGLRRGHSLECDEVFWQHLERRLR